MALSLHQQSPVTLGLSHWSLYGYNTQDPGVPPSWTLPGPTTPTDRQQTHWPKAEHTFMAKHCVALGDLGRRSLLRTWERACRKKGQASGMQIPGQTLHFPAGLAEVKEYLGRLSLVPQMGAGTK